MMILRGPLGREPQTFLLPLRQHRVLINILGHVTANYRMLLRFIPRDLPLSACISLRLRLPLRLLRQVSIGICNPRNLVARYASKKTFVGFFLLYFDIVVW